MWRCDSRTGVQGRLFMLKKIVSLITFNSRVLPLFLAWAPPARGCRTSWSEPPQEYTEPRARLACNAIAAEFVAAGCPADQRHGPGGLHCGEAVRSVPAPYGGPLSEATLPQGAVPYRGEVRAMCWGLPATACRRRRNARQWERSCSIAVSRLQH
jgi:hypothetical protein